MSSLNLVYLNNIETSQVVDERLQEAGDEVDNQQGAESEEEKGNVKVASFSNLQEGGDRLGQAELGGRDDQVEVGGRVDQVKVGGSLEQVELDTVEGVGILLHAIWEDVLCETVVDIGGDKDYLT